jgi:transposase
MSKTRKRYTEEFKREAIELWQTSEKSATAIEQDLGISKRMLYYWKKEFRKKVEAEADGSAAELAELKQLRKELTIVKQERDILKKAISIFSRTKE